MGDMLTGVLLGAGVAFFAWWCGFATAVYIYSRRDMDGGVGASRVGNDKTFR